MKTIISSIFFLLSSVITYSQYIEGRVFDMETNNPIEGVHVFIDNIENGDNTDSKGKYYINFQLKDLDSSYIHFSHVGYKNLSIPYIYKQKEYLVHLIKDINELSEVEIIEKRKLKPEIRYTKLKSMKSGVHSFGAILNDNKIYVVGGDVSYQIDGLGKAFDKYEGSNLSLIEVITKSYGSYNGEFYSGDFLIYNIATNTWETNKSKFEERAYHNLNMYNNELYTIGGIKLSKNRKFEYLNNSIDILNLNGNEIATDETNPHQAANFASFTYQDNIITLGGSIKRKRSGFKEYSNKIHFLDIKKGYWYELDTMTSGKETTGVLINDKIYLIGGFNKKPLSEIESYNLLTKKWEKDGNLFYGMAWPAVTHHKNTIYVYDNGKICTYNINTKELNEFHINLELQASKMYFSNNKLYLLGGVKATNYSLKPSAELYSIDISEFNNTKISRTKTL